MNPDLYELLSEQLTSLIDGDPYYLPVLANASALLMENLEQLNWAGFYLVKGGGLVLGPFQGKIACIHIRKGKGVCGTAWEKDETQRVEDVNKFPGHITCDAASRSELVIPIHSGGKIVGVLDLDSARPGRFREEDQAGLEKFVAVLEQSVKWDMSLLS